MVRFQVQNRRTQSLLSARKRRHKVWGLLLVLFVWSAVLGGGLAVAGSRPFPLAQAAPPATPPPAQSIGTVDTVPQGLQLAQQIYLQRCGTCHLAIPPAVMPTESWRALLLDPNHYGVQLQPLVQPDLSLVWKYLSTYSRRSNDDEQVPFRISKSRYFKIIHPRVDIPQRVSLSSCVTCHPGATKFDFRSLSPEWENAP